MRGGFTAIFGDLAKETASGTVEEGRMVVALSDEWGVIDVLASSYCSVGIASVHAGKVGFHLLGGQKGDVFDVER